MPKYQKRRNYKKKKFVKRKKKFVKRKSYRKKVEMIKTSEGTSDCQAISVTFHPLAPAQLPGPNGATMLIPKETYYRQTSKKNLIGSDGPALGSRISGNSVFSKYLNFRFKLSFANNPVVAFDDATEFSKVGRYRILAGVFHNAPVCAVPWLGWINGQGGLTSPDICDSDFEGVQWKTSMENELKAFYNGEKIWGGLTEKARWTLVHDKVYKSNPTTVHQQLSGQTEASADGKSLVAGKTVYTRPDIEGFIDFSKMKCCNKKLYYGPNVFSALAANHAQNQAAIYNPAIQGDRGLAATTAHNVPFVYIMNVNPLSTVIGGEPDLSARWVHYFQDA
jgi:hypothetical protein